MKRGRAVFIIFFIVLLFSTGTYAEQFPATGTVDVYFSPDGGATAAIVKEVNQAKSEMLVLAYYFSSAPIAKAIVDAKKRGVNVVAVLDKSQRSAKYSSADFLANAGIPTYIDSKHRIMHDKIIIIDRATLITGSFNFTVAAEDKNAENLLIMKGNKLLVERYINNFEEHKKHSVKYSGRLNR